mmetsp:Transcript_27359/g.88366  ORF Transcript_27359/g.88366 Transcript_27359/m.88366 type:complete len:182 (+) Transcript_27359:23-568(+)
MMLRSACALSSPRRWLGVWSKKLRPARRPEANPRTQAFLKKLSEDYDWKTYRQDFRNTRTKGKEVVRAVEAEDRAKRTIYDIPDFCAGDAIEMSVKYELSEEKRQRVKGLVIARTRRGIESSVLLYCVVANTPHLRRIPLYSPLVQNMSIIRKAFLHKGKKRVRRAKLYYLIDQKKNIRAP